MSNARQLSFSSGELAPSLHARTDLQKYAAGLRTLRNFLIQRHGGVANRAGTHYVAEAKDSGDLLRLIPFVQSEDARFVLEFGNQTLRFVQDSEHVTIASADAWADATAYAIADLVSQSGTFYYATEAHTSATATDQPGAGSAWQTKWHPLTSGIYELPTPYLAGDLAAIQFVQTGPILYLVHPDYAPQKLTRISDTAWTLEIVVFGPTITPPTGTAATGGDGTVEDTFWAITTIAEETFEESQAVLFDETTVVPTTAAPTTLTWNPVEGAREYVVYRSTDGGRSYGYVGTAGGIRIAQTDSTWSDSSETASTTSPGGFVAAPGQCRNDLTLADVADKAVDGFYTVHGRITVQASGGTSTFIRGQVLAYYSRDGEPRVEAGVIGVIERSSSMGTDTFSEAIKVPDNGYTTLTIDLVPEVYGEGSGATWTATLSFGAAPYNKITWEKIGAGFVDDGSIPDMAIRPPTFPNLFNAPDRYPATVGFYQQRLALARTNDEPAKVWASQSALPLNFGTSTPILDADAVTFTLVARRQNDVRHIIDLDHMLIGTSESWWAITGNEAGTLVPGETNPKQLTYHGAAADLAPLVVGASVLYVQARGVTVRDLYRDANGYQGLDLTVPSAHLFDGHTIVDWAYQEIPHTVIWIVRDDGILLGLTYSREYGLWGWHRHDTAGTVENVCVIPEGTEDALYLVVQRTIDGSDVRYIERMASRFFADQVDAVFMDSAVTYDGVATTTITGLDHLEGESVSVLADGHVVASPNNPDYEPIVVASGQITIPDAASVVHVGLPYLSDLETLDIDNPTGPSMKERLINIQKVKAHVVDTRGMWAGPQPPEDDDVDPTEYLSEVKTLQQEPDDPIELVTDTVQVTIGGRWATGRVFIRQIDPLPIAIQSIIPIGVIE